MTPDDPIEILPWGRTEEQQAKLDLVKVRGKRGLKLFLLQLIACGLIVIAACIYGSNFR